MPEQFLPLAVAAIIGGVIGRPLGPLASMFFGGLPPASAKGAPRDVVRCLMACGGAGGMAGPMLLLYRLPIEDHLYALIMFQVIAGIILGAWMGRGIARLLPVSAFSRTVRYLNAVQMACVVVFVFAAILTWARTQN